MKIKQKRKYKIEHDKEKDTAEGVYNPRNKFLKAISKINYRRMNITPKIKLKFEILVFKYGYFLLIPPIIFLLLINFISALFLNIDIFTIFRFIFLQPSSYKWLALIVPIASFLFGVHKYIDGKKIVIGSDAVISRHFIGFQYLSRTANTEFIKMSGYMLVTNYQGEPILTDDYKNCGHIYLYHDWFEFIQKYENYEKWIPIEGYDIVEYGFSREQVRNIITWSVRAYYFYHPRTIDKNFFLRRKINIEDFQLVMHYYLNHKYLRHSNILDIGKAAKLFFDKDELEKIQDKYWNMTHEEINTEILKEVQ